MKCFLYTPDGSFSEEFLLHSSCYVRSGVFLTHLTVSVRSVSLPPLIVLVTTEFLLHSSGYVWLGLSFSYTRQTMFGEEFLLHS